MTADDDEEEVDDHFGQSKDKFRIHFEGTAVYLVGIAAHAEAEDVIEAEEVVYFHLDETTADNIAPGYLDGTAPAHLDSIPIHFEGIAGHLDSKLL